MSIVSVFRLPTAIQCEVPRNPLNGRAVYSSVSYNSLISYECNYGYMLIGDSVRRCERNKQWTGTEPHCKGKLFFGFAAILCRRREREKIVNSHQATEQISYEYFQTGDSSLIRNQLRFAGHSSQRLAGGQSHHTPRGSHV